MGMDKRTKEALLRLKDRMDSVLTKESVCTDTDEIIQTCRDFLQIAHRQNRLTALTAAARRMIVLLQAASLRDLMPEIMRTARVFQSAFECLEA